MSDQRPMNWLEELAAESRRRLDALPPEIQPAWYRRNAAERRAVPDNVIPINRGRR